MQSDQEKFNQLVESPLNVQRLTDEQLGWHFFENFKKRSFAGECDWPTFNGLFRVAETSAGSMLKQLEELLNPWSSQLQEFGGDPAFRDWQGFRVLRLEREEDWSDWLAFLLETSNTGALCAQLFRVAAPASFIHPTVTREMTTLDGSYRSDIVVRGSQRSINVEIKVGDENFDKTFAMCEGIQKCLAGHQLSHYILIPDESVDAWRGTQRDRKIEIVELRWRDVVTAIRVSLLMPDENTAWKIWALSFCGAIEQKILRWPPLRKEKATSVREWVALGERVLLIKQIRMDLEKDGR
jgi:hypothetical protein